MSIRKKRHPNMYSSLVGVVLIDYATFINFDMPDEHTIYLANRINSAIIYEIQTKLGLMTQFVEEDKE